MAKEIERKWVVSQLPALPWEKVSSIRQIYLAVEEDVEVRVRQKNAKFFITVKAGSGLTRTEVEREISAEEFAEISSAVDGRRVEKTRYVLDGIEVDQYHGHLEGLITVEVEFHSTKAAKKFMTPSWFGKEVTEDKRYKNKALALHGRPQD